MTTSEVETNATPEVPEPETPLVSVKEKQTEADAQAIAFAASVPMAATGERRAELLQAAAPGATITAVESLPDSDHIVFKLSDGTSQVVLRRDAFVRANAILEQVEKFPLSMSLEDLEKWSWRALKTFQACFKNGKARGMEYPPASVKALESRAMKAEKRYRHGSKSIKHPKAFKG